MNRGILNENLIEKNIEKIKFYADEENKKLNQIYNVIAKLEDCYKSSNSLNIINSMYSFKNNINDIYTKRNEYVKILNFAIFRYKDLSLKTVNLFSEDL